MLIGPRTLLAATVVVPFLPVAPPAPRLAGLPACVPKHLHAEASLQGATGSLLGALALRNVGSNTCVLRVPLTLTLLAPSGRALALRTEGRGSALGALALRLDPGEAGTAGLQLWNACDPGSKAHLWVVLPRGGGRIDIGLGAGGRCDVPGEPPGYVIGGLQPADQPRLSKQAKAQHALHVGQIAAPATTRAGAVVDYTVSVTNRSANEVRTSTCPLFYEQLWLWKQNLVITHQYVLNCRGLEALASRSTTLFEMRLAVPRDARGNADIEWGFEDRAAPIPVRAPMSPLLNGPVGVEPWSSGRTTLQVTAP